MKKITISIPDELENKLKKHPNLIRSKLFQQAAEKELKILGLLNEKETSNEVKEIILRLRKDYEDNELSFQFGKDMSIEWMKEARYSDVIKLASIAEKENIFDKLYELIGKEKFEGYKETFTEMQDGEILDQEEFSKGFVIEAKMIINAVKDLK
jgi:hypothetical protein